MPTDYTQDQDFLNAPSDQQHAYLTSVDPDYAKAKPEEQKAYLSHLNQGNPLVSGQGMEQKAAEQAKGKFGETITKGPEAQGQDLLAHISGHDTAPLNSKDANSQLLNTMGRYANAVTDAYSAPSLLSNPRMAARAVVGGTIGAAAGNRVGEDVGGVFGPTGRKVGGVVGSIGGGLYGGGMGANIERNPTTLVEQAEGKLGRVKPLPFGIQRFLPDWMVGAGPQTEVGPAYMPKTSDFESDLASRSAAAQREALQAGRNSPGPWKPGAGPQTEVPEPELGTPENPGWYSKLSDRFKAGSPISASGESAAATRRRLTPLIYESEPHYQQTKALNERLGTEATNAGRYSAARGSVKKPLDYQERIAKKVQR